MASTVLKTLHGPLKKTTGLTGLKVLPNPHHTLRIVYGKILRTLAKMPEDAVYRQETEKLVMARLRAVEEEPVISELEKRINCGLIEEVVEQAQNEMSLARKMVECRVWEPLQTHPPADQWKWPLQ